MTTKTKVERYVGTEDASGPAYVLGSTIGNYGALGLLAIGSTIEDAISEYDERFGVRIDVDDPDIADYEGETIEDRLEYAMSCGDVRVNDGGTMVWVDPCEWIREFPNPRAAVEWCREFAR